MPLVSWGNGGGDYSTGFAYLARNAELTYEANARAADDKRLSDLAAKDALVFDQFNAGKMSGDELLAYMHKRISQLGYDKTQQDAWKGKLIQYQQQIADTKAIDAYNANGDINSIIAYFRHVQSQSAKGSPRYDAASAQLKSLIGTRDSQALTSGVARIQTQIAKHQATSSDLLAFLRQQLKVTTDPSIKVQIQQQIAQATQAVKVDQFTAKVGSLQSQLTNKSITNQQYSTALTSLVGQYSTVLTPDARLGYLHDAQTTARTIDDSALVAKGTALITMGDVAGGTALLQQAANEVYGYNQTEYWALTTQIWQAKTSANGQLLPSLQGNTPYSQGNPYSGYTPGSVSFNQRQIGNVDWISQMDGSAFANTNCVMAAGAMLAASLGYSGLTGADLRYRTGDTSGGTNFSQLQAALTASGVDSSKLRQPDGWSFDRFKQAIQNGSGAVLGGPYVNLPNSITNISGAPRTGGHGVYIASYDPRKGFLLLDPAVSQSSHPGYKGVWISEAALRNFYDASGGSQYHGLLLTQPHVIGNPNIGSHSPRVPNYTSGGGQHHGGNPNPQHDTGSTGQDHHHTGGSNPPPVENPPSQPGHTPTPSFAANPGAEDHPTPITFIGVDAQPKVAPQSYAGLYSTAGHPGVNPVVTAQGTPQATKPSVIRGLDGKPIVTIDEAKRQMTLEDARQSTYTTIINAYIDHLNGNSTSPTVTIGGVTYPLTDQYIQRVHQQQLQGLDQAIAIADGTKSLNGGADGGLKPGDSQYPDQYRAQKSGVITAAKSLNTAPVANLFNSLLSNTNRMMADAQKSTDPNAVNSTLDKIAQAWAAFDRTETTASQNPLAGPTPALTAHIHAMAEATQIARDPNLTADQKQQAFQQIEAGDTVTKAKDGVDPLSLGSWDSKAPDRGDAGSFLRQYLTTSQGTIDVANGTKAMVLVMKPDPKTGRPIADPSLVNVITDPYVNPDGTPHTHLDTSALNAPQSAVQTTYIDGKPVQFLPMPVQVTQTLRYNQSSANDAALDKLIGSHFADGYLSNADLAKLGPTVLQQLIQNHTLTADPVSLNAAVINGQVQYQDPGTGAWHTTLPVQLGPSIPGVKDSYSGTTDRYRPTLDATWTTDKGNPVPTDGKFAGDLQKLVDNGTIPGSGVIRDPNTEQLIAAPGYTYDANTGVATMTDQKAAAAYWSGVFKPAGFAPEALNAVAGLKPPPPPAPEQQNPFSDGGTPVDPFGTGTAPNPGAPLNIPQGIPAPGQDRIGGQPPSGFTPYDPTGASQGFQGFDQLTAIASQLGIKTPQTTPTPSFTPPTPQQGQQINDYLKNEFGPKPAVSYVPPGPITQPPPTNWRAQNPPNSTTSSSQPKPKPYVPPPPPATRRTTGGSYES